MYVRKLLKKVFGVKKESLKNDFEGVKEESLKNDFEDVKEESLKYDFETAKLITTGNEVLNKNIFPILSKNGGNLVYSPISVHAILSLAYLGAAGETAQSLQNVLSLTDAKTVAEGYQFWMEKLNSLEYEKLKIANKIFINKQYEINKEFNSTAKTYFLSEAENINFEESNEAAKNINKWVEGKTNNLIKDLVNSSDFSSNTCLFMVNAVYFKGDWLEKFCFTKESKFYLSETDTVDCIMMKGQEYFAYGEDEDLDAQILMIPYKSQMMSLLVILPRSKTGINMLCEKLKTKNLSELNKNLDTAEVSISIPKCRIETTLELNVPLSKLGLDGMFTGSAEFPNLLKSSTPIKVNKIVQKAFIDINEEGTEAAAATGCECVPMCGRIYPKRVTFNANHPFVFCVCYHQDSLLLPTFMGILKQPQKK